MLRVGVPGISLFFVPAKVEIFLALGVGRLFVLQEDS